MNDNDEDLYDPETPDNKAWKIDAPTPAQIRERCLEIQLTWDEETRRSRIADYRMHPDYVHEWVLPVIAVRDLDMDAMNAVGGVNDAENDDIRHTKIVNLEEKLKGDHIV